MFVQAMYNDRVLLVDKHSLYPYYHLIDHDTEFLFPVHLLTFSKINNLLLPHHKSLGDAELSSISNFFAKVFKR